MNINPSRIMDMASAFQDSAILFAASDLGIFGAVAKSAESTAADVAGAVGLDERAATLIMDACVAVGLLQKEDSVYRNTPESGAFLVPGGPGDLSKAVWYMRDVYPVWGRLKDFGKSGRPSESPQLHLGDDEARTRAFVMSMHGKALATGAAVVAKLPLAGCRRLLDVGGGPGTYSILISKAYPELHATVLDLPPVIRIASGLIEQQGASARVSALPGDYHVTPFPGDNDAVLFFGMMHQESVEGIQSLLRKAYDAMTPGASVYIMDMMTDPSHTAPKFSALFAVNMALTTESGWVFSSAELEGWTKAAGFVDFEVHPLPPPIPHWLASARKPRQT
jgi:3-hydroxy-5-methyl-1-naphthoate 3-O-methyltransferase